MTLYFTSSQPLALFLQRIPHISFEAVDKCPAASLPGKITQAYTLPFAIYDGGSKSIQSFPLCTTSAWVRSSIGKCCSTSDLLLMFLDFFRIAWLHLKKHHKKQQDMHPSLPTPIFYHARTPPTRDQSHLAVMPMSNNRSTPKKIKGAIWWRTKKPSSEYWLGPCILWESVITHRWQKPAV